MSFERVGSQTWQDLLFVHWEVPPQFLRPRLPPGLELDTFDGRAYVGLIPFLMRDVRPVAVLPPVPTAATFPEINLRTYVRFGGEPGVWFFSLDAASGLAVIGGRALFHLPYHRADATIGKDKDTTVIDSVRRWPEPRAGRFRARYTVGEPLGIAEPGTLRHFLVERYTLYTLDGSDNLARARVRHAPYPLWRAKVERVDETLMAAARLPSNGNRTEDYFSSGVTVDVTALEAV